MGNLQADPRRAKGRAVVVDDDVVVLSAVSEWLEDLGYEVETSRTWIGLSGRLTRRPPDLVILDLGLPGLTEDQLATLVGRQRDLNDCWVVLYSGRAMGELDAIARRTGALGAIEKTGGKTGFVVGLQRLTTRRRDK